MDLHLERKSVGPKFDEVIQEYKIPLILGVGSISCFMASLFLLVKSIQTVEPIHFSNIEQDSSQSGSLSSRMVIDIAGAVVKPGVYTLQAGSRIEDAIKESGGFTDNVDPELVAKTVNRAQKIQDGMKIYIQSREPAITSHNDDINYENPPTSYNDLSQAIVGGSEFTLISLNASSQSELETLPGIGPITAEKIISSRPYNDIQELVGRKIIGQKLFEKVKNSLSL